jgi:hypothetical protein
MSDNDIDKGFDDELMARARGLATDVEPERDLWPDLEASIRQPRGRGFDWRMMAGQAAAILILVGGSSGITWLAVKDDRPQLSPVSIPAAMPLTAESASFGADYTLGPGFLDARRDLEGRLERELQRLSPEARADVEANMQTIRTAIAEINTALAEEPDNVLLQELLLSTYREELSLMRKVNGITNAVMLREDI